MNARPDPLRVAYLDALRRRAAGQPAAVRALLEAKFAVALTEFERRVAAVPQVAQSDRAQAGAPGPLAELVRYLEGHPQDEQDEQDDRDGAAPDQPPAPVELRAVRDFRDTWAQLSAARQLNHAIAQAPQNAGPLNSHYLVLRSLERMHQIAPAYLQRFLAYTDTLLQLDRSMAKPTAKKPARVRAATR